MPIGEHIRRKYRDQKGASLIIVALMMVVFLSLGALAVDLAHLYLVRNELQNAADAGALAGARFLYTADGSQVNVNADQIALNAAIANQSAKVPVEVSAADVQRGHWSFMNRTFTPNNSTAPVSLWNVSFEELDANPDFINAVRVRVHRKQIPVASFFAKIFGLQNFLLSAEAVAYIGFAGTVGPNEIDIPVAICKESILVGGKYSCNIGRMMDSSGRIQSSETAYWTTFETQERLADCSGASSASDLRRLLMGNPDPIFLGEYLTTTNGVVDSVFKDLERLWIQNTGKTTPWKVSALVVDCGATGPTCKKIIGTVVVNIVWIQRDNDPQFKDAPFRMGNWFSNDADGRNRWNSFVQYFSLKNADGTPAPYNKKSIYFLPDCEPHEPVGRTGGENFSVLAKIPVLVN